MTLRTAFAVVWSDEIVAEYERTTFGGQFCYLRS